MASHRRSARVVRGVLWGLAAVHVAEAVALRQRRRKVAALATDDGDGDGDSEAVTSPGEAAGPLTVLSAAGTGLDGATRAAVRREMDLLGLEAVDLVPGDLSADRWIRLLRRVDASTLGLDPTRSQGGANEALALLPSLADRMGAEGDAEPDRGTLARETTRAQRYAPAAHDLRLAPGVTAAPVTGEDRWREMEGVTDFAWPYGSWPPFLAAIETGHLLALTAGALVAPVPGLAALATWMAQPATVLSGVDEHSPAPAALVADGLRRLPRAWRANLAAIAAGYRATQQREAERRATPLPPALTPEEQFEPRRDTCPWCGSSSLVGRLDVPDLLLHKPGEYHLDECRDCGHVFQNPRLTIAGLDYVYDNAYEGTGEALAEVTLAYIGHTYRSRVASLDRFHQPKALLDVGTGHGHFLLYARQQWPEATLDALDMSETVEEAQRRGWADTAYRGVFMDLAGSLPRSYDTVTMHHYLEHTREPREELAAAAKVLEPGGYLMLEVPDAEDPWARRLGQYWYPWGQPQHQHFMPTRNLVAALEEAGFEVLSLERGPVTLGGDVFNGIGLVMQRVARSPHLPWLPDPGPLHRLKRMVLFAAVLPAMAAAKVFDAVKDRRLENDTPSNAYRIVARRV